MSDKWYLSGPLGIGATEPKRTLHVEGHEIHSGGTVAGLSFQNRQSPNFVEMPTSGERWVWYASEGAGRLWSGSDKLTVSKEGNVGIGTNMPKAPLHVSGLDSASIRLVSSDPVADFAYDGGTDSVFWFVHHGADSGATHFRSRNRDLLVIKNDGKVGIGTNAPQALLDVNGNLQTWSLQVKTKLSVEDVSARNVLLQNSLQAKSLTAEYCNCDRLEVTSTLVRKDLKVDNTIEGCVLKINKIFALEISQPRGITTDGRTVPLLTDKGNFVFFKWTDQQKFEIWVDGKRVTAI